jgi:hypothetical protein
LPIGKPAFVARVTFVVVGGDAWFLPPLEHEATRSATAQRSAKRAGRLDITLIMTPENAKRFR